MRASKEARLAERHREQVARLVALATCHKADGTACGECLQGVLSGKRFDLALVRAYGERLVAMERHAGVHSVVDDWRRERGRVPVERRNGHRLCPSCIAAGRIDSGGACDECNGNGVVYHVVKCERSGLPPGLERDAMNWRAHVRLGRRLLAAIEGQPSECQAAGCEGGLVDIGYHASVYRTQEACELDCAALTKLHQVRLMGAVDRIAARQPRRHGDVWRIHEFRNCETCHGTGHNLAGTLPPITDSEATIVAAADALTLAHAQARPGWMRDETEHGGWVRDVYERNVERVEALLGRTRVVPRGEHRDFGTQELRAYGSSAWFGRRPNRQVAENVAFAGATSDQIDAIEARLAADFERRTALLPRWRRGELRHSEQRRERTSSPAPQEFHPIARGDSMLAIVGLAYATMVPERRTPVGDAIASLSLGVLAGDIARRLRLTPPWSERFDIQNTLDRPATLQLVTASSDGSTGISWQPEDEEGDE